VARGDMALVLNTGLWMVGVALIGLVGGVGCGVFAVLAGQNFGADLRGAAFRKVQALSFGNLDKLETGGLITRLTNDITQLQEVVMMMLRIMVRVPLLLVGSLIMAVLTSPRLGLIFVVVIPVVLVLLVWVINKTYPLFGEVQRRLDALNTVMQENLAGVRVVKAFARALHEIGRFGRTNDALMDKNIAAVRASAITMPLMMLVLNGGVVAALWFGGLQVNAGGLEVGQLIAFINYLSQTLMSLMMISMLVVRFARAEASAQRVDEVLANEPLIRPSPSPRQQPATEGRVTFERVSFHYDEEPQTADGEPQFNEQQREVVFRGGQRSAVGGQTAAVLKDISFVAEPGQTVALLGATGAGKSSLVNLVPRFYDVSGGRVTIDGVDVRDYAEPALRRSVSAALQESVLFSGTIRDNIRYGRSEASDDEVVEAAKMAQAHEFISGFPHGYDSIVGQRGVNLSGGQKQRIAIARALLTRPKVLILDDSTSAVDVATESKIQAALAALPERPTRLVVAQRISTVLSADKILVLDDGYIVAEGSHAELLETSPIYREIYESQIEHGAVAHD
jgi:ATP-binding cassette subfamily B protein